jgi:hypothetical protein
MGATHAALRRCLAILLYGHGLLLLSKNIKTNVNFEQSDYLRFALI